MTEETQFAGRFMETALVDEVSTDQAMEADYSLYEEVMAVKLG